MGRLPRQLQRNGYITPCSVSTCCYCLPSTKGSWWGPLKSSQYEHCLSPQHMKEPPQGPALRSRQGARAGVLLQHFELRQGKGAAGWIPADGNLMPTCRTQHTCILDMKNSPFQPHSNLGEAEHPRARIAAFASRTLLLLSCLPHSVYLWSSQVEKGSRRACGKLYTQQHSKKR